MRNDAFGFLWNDVPVVKEPGAKVKVERGPRPMPPIPDNGWRAPQPSEFPRLDKAEFIALDTETKDPELLEKGPGVRREGCHIVGISVAVPDGQSWYFPIRHEVGAEQNLPVENVMAWARDNLTRPGQMKVGTNILYDLDYLAEEGVEVAGPFYDVQVAEALLDENANGYDLDSISWRRIGKGKTTEELEDWALRAYGEKNYKKNIYRCPPQLVGPYAQGDAINPIEIMRVQIPLLRAEGLTELFAIESGLTEPLLAMRRRGVRVNLKRAQQIDDQLTKSIEEESAKLKALCGFEVNVNSKDHLIKIFDAQGLSYPRTPPSKRFPNGQPSFVKEFLEHHEHPIAKLITSRRGWEKFRDTFVRGYVFDSHIRGRIHCLFNQTKTDEYGTVSGRFCVHGDTLLRTSCGEVKIKDLDLRKNPTIETHRGRQRRILKKVYKGEEGMLQVTLANGSFIICTKNHRLLTPTGWSKVNDLRKGFEVCCSGLPKRSRLPDPCSSGAEIWAKEQSPNKGIPGVHTQQNIQREEENKVLAVQGREEQSHDRKDRGAAPQLEGGLFGSQRLLNREAGRQKTLPAPPGCLQGLGPSEDTEGLAGTPSGRGYREQSAGQFSPDDGQGPLSFTSSSIVSIKPVGTGEVWDIEVEEDSSYAAQGMIHHNSSSLPNLQNIPARDPFWGPLIRSMFMPDLGHGWSKLDWSQIEYRFLVHIANRVLNGKFGSAEAVKKYRSDPNTDYHNYVSDITSVERKHAKNINFGLVYGMGEPELARQLGIDIDEATPIFQQYHTALPFVKEIRQRKAHEASEKGYITTVLGRRRRFELWEPRFSDFSEDNERKALPMSAAMSKWGNRIRRAYTHKALNGEIQGSAADLMKLAMKMYWERKDLVAELGPWLLTVHDEGDISTPKTKAAKEAVLETKRLMESCMKLSIPVIAELSTGPNWGSTK
jgi:DNA polymerase I-like protein with 3'-5' exonuclease and polymerase domains